MSIKISNFVLSMKQVFHKIMSLLMAFVVFFSTMSFTVDMHYCGGTLVDTAIFQKVKTCGMDSDNYRNETPLKEGCSITKKNCCSDEQLVLDGQDELQLQVDQISLEQQVFITSFIYTHINRFEAINKKASSFKKYKPPLLVKEIFKLEETYLI